MSISTETLNEILTDSILITSITRIQKNIKNEWLQEIYSTLWVCSFSIFMHELLQAGIVKKEDIPPDTVTVLKRVRQRFLKKRANEESNTIIGIREDMGLDFNHYVFDIRLSLDRDNPSNLYVINFSYWDLNHINKEQVELINTAGDIPFNIINSCLLPLGDEIKDFFNKLDEIYPIVSESIESTVNLSNVCYSSSQLFNKSINNEHDKIFIMFYYTLVHTLLIFDEIIPDLFDMKVDPFVLKPHNTKIKLKAVIIEMLGNDIRNVKTPLVEKLNKDINKAIKDKSFFSLNRKLRNNIHYGETLTISDEEYEILEKYQIIYLETVISVFKSKINIKLGKGYRFIKWLANHTDSKVRSGEIGKQ